MWNLLCICWDCFCVWKTLLRLTLFGFFSRVKKEQNIAMLSFLLPLLFTSFALADLAPVNLCNGAAGCCGTGISFFDISFYNNHHYHPLFNILVFNNHQYDQNKQGCILTKKYYQNQQGCIITKKQKKNRDAYSGCEWRVHGRLRGPRVSFL